MRRLKIMALNILVVDDSAVMRAMIIKTLRLSRVPIGEIHEANNGDQRQRSDRTIQRRRHSSSSRHHRIPRRPPDIP